MGLVRLSKQPEDLKFGLELCVSSSGIMAKVSFFKNYRVYLLTSVAYMGSLLFGTFMNTIYCEVY
jgi:hypothetical protein